MNKHTPGPWKFRDDSKHFKTNPFSVYVQGGGVHSAAIANMPNKKTIPESEAKANALLIAAAPDLLEALQDLLEVVAGHDAPKSLGELGVIGRASRAINKAIGDVNG
jgi:hypothetical protein